MVEGCARIVKFIVFFFNLLFWLVGLAVMSVGIWLRVSKGDYGTLVTSVPYASAANLIIAVGLIVMIIGFVGCLGAWKENKCLLMTFFILLLIIFIIEIAAGILGYVYRGKVEKYVKEDMMAGMANYDQAGQEGLTGTWDRLQTQEECCGVTDYRDWFTAFPNKNGTWLPDSCCKTVTDGCGMTYSNTTRGDFNLDKGCAEPLEKFLADNLYVIGGIGIAIAVIQLLGMIFALFLFCEVRKESGGKYA
ncbi:tetraspanin-4-like [Ptychodera flava]|uniref:tetraspanin-4-like n=1 Tax=Ptychodera flava TaxID=63121 RepID=UPI003969D50D